MESAGRTARFAALVFWAAIPGPMEGIPLPAIVATAAGPIGVSARIATDLTPSAQEPQRERVPDAAVVDGIPRGIFVGRSLLTGRAVCLLFLGGGRVTRAIPTGGLEDFDWARHRADHPGDSGTWRMVGGELEITWGDSGVQRGPLQELQGGIEFQGKRYARPSMVNASALAGRWESARGMAVTGGEGVNETGTLLIEPDGRYRWIVAGGGVVGGRAASGSKARTGRIEIAGATITFRADDGTATSHTFIPVTGTPLTAFSVDTDLFTRSD